MLVNTGQSHLFAVTHEEAEAALVEAFEGGGMQSRESVAEMCRAPESTMITVRGDYPLLCRLGARVQVDDAVGCGGGYHCRGRGGGWCGGRACL